MPIEVSDEDADRLDSMIRVAVQALRPLGLHEDSLAELASRAVRREIDELRKHGDPWIRRIPPSWIDQVLSGSILDWEEANGYSSHDTPSPPEFLDLREVGDALNCSLKTVRRLIRLEKLPVTIVHGMRKVRVAELWVFAESTADQDRQPGLWIRGQRAKWNLEMGELAARAEIPVDRLLDLESGLERPTEQEIDQIAKGIAGASDAVERRAEQLRISLAIRSGHKVRDAQGRTAGELPRCWRA